jgi:valyl-tRNA synthetase
MKLSKTYQPGEYEPNIYALWEASGAFSPSGQGEPYSIVMPPPNANGNLHIGHALFVACEDVLTRYHRMQGRDTIWIPGADHAGFETWVVFEKYLESQGQSRFDFSRGQLYQMTWDFVASNRGNMEMQLRALGASCDWKHQVFTLDDKVTDVVFTTFKKLWDDGLIYRGNRIVSYCTYHDTSFADIEVEYQDEKGKLWYIDYPLASGQGSVTVATTRPETMLGDEAVAVNPSDKRYAKLVGQKLMLPIVEKEIPIIADEAVEYDFGTGAVKVTPAHDPTDFDIGQRHNLPVTSVIGYDGKIIAPAPEEFVGLDVDTARKQVVQQLEHQGLISKIEDYEHQVPHCYKCGRVIQPLVKDQWFVSVQPLVKKAIAAIRAGKIKFTPRSKGEELIRYYQELRDWNISRQIPWGIPIPAFHRVDCNSHSKLDLESRPTEIASPSDVSETASHPGLARVSRRAQLGAAEVSETPESSASSPEWIFDTRVDQDEIEVDGVTYKRDEDTFDTWFSSGQWPYIVTRGDLERFYPTTTMETGFDILRQWVARMIMLGLYISDDVPFREVYLHGLVNDEHNQKMSKSKGNVINPMDIVDEYGSDAMRLGILANRSAAMSQAFSPATVVAGRNFCNKLWNIARFIGSTATPQDAFSDALVSSKRSDPGDIPMAKAGDPVTRSAPLADKSGEHQKKPLEGFAGSLADCWVLRQLGHAREQMEKLLAEYRFAEAYEVLYHVVWDDVADWYVEATKLEYPSFAGLTGESTEENNVDSPTRAANDMRMQVLEYVLKLAHPFAPFVTETIWQSIYSDDKSTTLLISQQWPEAIKTNKADSDNFESIKKTVSEIRNIKAEIGQGKGNLIVAGDGLVAKNVELVKHLAKLEEIEIGSGQGIRLTSTEAYLVADDGEVKSYYDKLTAKLAQVRSEIAKLEGRLSNESYVKNAPEKLVAESRAELTDKKALAKKLEQESGAV